MTKGPRKTKAKRRPKALRQSSADRKEGLLQSRVSTEIHPLLQRAADVLTFGRVSGFLEKAIVESAQKILPDTEQAQRLPRSPQTPKSQAILAGQCVAIAERIQSLSDGRATFGYRADPLMSSCLVALLRAHIDGSPPPPLPMSEWLRVPAAAEEPATAPKISCTVELATVARLELVQEQGQYTTTRLAVEHCAWEKLRAHNLDKREEGVLVFEAFPPRPLLSFSRYLDDAMMPLTQVLAELPGGSANAELKEAMQRLRQVLIEHPAPPRK